MAGRGGGGSHRHPARSLSEATAEMAGADCVLRLSWEGFADVCRALAERVAREYQPDVVVGIARGGTLPGALIALLLRRDFQSLRVPAAGLRESLPAYLPPREMIAGRRVLVVDERAPDGAALRWVAEALGKLGARDIRTLILFAGGQAAADFMGPEMGVKVLQPWIRDAVAARPSMSAAEGCARGEVMARDIWS